ncbi:type VI secretion system Vgr family protein [Candidatus Pantoea formicae]|uniref:type VI secretion system Vgr family protein n=1 Tax=Candidatus Pantoea formicae TaxID=2608355 RepID=UPI003EDB37AF
MNQTGSLGISHCENSFNRYLLFFYNKEIVADVASFEGRELLSHPYRFSIRFTSPVQDISPDKLMLQPATFVMRSSSLEWSQYRPGEDAWQPLRKIHGIITRLSRISTSADEASYEVILEHPLALLASTRRYAIYQDSSVPELVITVLQSHGFHGYEIDMSLLQWHYPKREMIVQWGETDLCFIQRLLSEVGIWFRFRKHETAEEMTVIVFGDQQGGYVFGAKILSLPLAGLTGDTLTIRQMRCHSAVVPASVLVRDYDYRQSRRVPPQHDADMGGEAPYTTGRDYHYADIQHSAGDRWNSTPGGEAETAWHYACIRHERHLASRTRLEAITDDPALQPGIVVDIDGEKPEAFVPGFLILESVCRAGRAAVFQAEISGIPYSERAAYRPERLPRPVISGTVPARISGTMMNDSLARPDRQGRYRVKFCFDLDSWDKGRESMPVRLARIYAGDKFGVHFPLLDNMEVAIAFEGGDPERPYIAHVLHDEINPDVVNDLNSTRNVIRTRGKNKIRMEDAAGSEHVKVSTEFGKTQLNLGHLVDADRKARGAGAELRTDHHAAVRAAEGIYLTTSVQTGARGKQLDMAETITHLEQALGIAYSLQAAATGAGAEGVDTAPQQALQQAVSGLAKPGILSWGEAGIVQATPESLHLAAGKDAVITAGSNGSVSVFKALSVAAGQGISAFARRIGIKLIAATGDITLQAQRGQLAALSDQNMQITSVNGELQISAKKGLYLHCGGGGIRLHPNGGVEIFSPARIEQKAPTLIYQKGESAKIVDPVFKDNPLARGVRLFRNGDRKHPLVSQPFRVTRPDGSTVEGTTDDTGHSPLLDLAETEQLVVTLIREAKQ